jgi:regulatory protein
VVIRQLKPSQHVEGRWLAFLEDGTLLRLGESEVVQFALYAGKELDENQAAALQESAQRGARREKAIELLSRKPLSRRELERKLREWEAGEEETAALCARMEELGYLDDAAYARRVVRHYAAKGYGERKLRDELYRRGVPRDLWDAALADLDDPAETIDAFVAKKLAGREIDRKELKKVSDALARRGYSWTDISAALRRYGAQGDE